MFSYQLVALDHFVILKLIFKNHFLMITQVGEKQNNGDLKGHYEGIRAVNELIKKSNNQSINYNYKQYADEEHGSIPMIGSIDFLRWIFDGYRINIKAVPSQSNLIESSFEKFSKRLNYTFQPSETYINLVANYLMKQNKNELAKYYFELNVTRFPESLQAKEQLKKFITSNKID